MIVAIDRIFDGPRTRYQPVSADADRALADSVAAIGILVPILVRPIPGTAVEPAPIPVNGSNQPYEVVCGFRRLAAARAAGLADIPVEVRELDDGAALAAQLAEATLRERLHPVDGWLAVKAMMDGGMSEAMATRAIGVTGRGLQQMRWLGRLTRPMLDLCRLDMPPERTLRVIAVTDPDRQIQASELPGIRPTAAAGGDDDQDDNWDNDDNSEVAWHRIAEFCRHRRYPRAWAAFDLDIADIAWDQDWLAQPGSPDEWTTADGERFMAAQLTALEAEAKAAKRTVVITCDPKTGVPRMPAGMRRDWSDPEKLGRGQKRALILEASGRVVRATLTPVDATGTPGASDDDDTAADTDATDSAEDADAPDIEAPAPTPAATITLAGHEIIRQRKERAFRDAMMADDIDPDDLILLLTLAWCASNVSVQASDRDARRRVAARLIGPDGNLRSDVTGPVINACARTMLCEVVHFSDVHINGPVSGAAGEWIGRLAGADARLPRFDDEAFLAQCKGDEIRRIAELAQVKMPATVTEARKRLQDQAETYRPDAAAFGAAGPT